MYLSSIWGWVTRNSIFTHFGLRRSGTAGFVIAAAGTAKTRLGTVFVRFVGFLIPTPVTM